MGNIDRIVRVVLAAVLAGLYFGGVNTGTLGLVLVILGGVFLATSLMGFCPPLPSIWLKYLQNERNENNLN